MKGKRGFAPLFCFLPLCLAGSGNGGQALPGLSWAQTWDATIHNSWYIPVKPEQEAQHMEPAGLSQRLSWPLPCHDEEEW